MKDSPDNLLLGLILSFVFTSFSSAQLKWNINTEGGFFRSKSNASSMSSNLLLRMDGNLKYFYSEDNVLASAELRVRPEFYGFDNILRSAKYRVTGEYYKKEDQMSWGINLAGQKNNYRTNNNEFSYDNYMIAINSDWFEYSEYPATTQLGYAYQTANDNIEQNLDILFFNGKLFKTLFPRNTSGVGLYIERFSIVNKFIPTLSNTGNKNSGWRYGPQISFEYLENIILSFEYRFLFHSSQITVHPSNEHWMRILAGKMFSDKWSLFFLADYYVRRFTFKGERLVESFLIYNPLDNENKLHVKLAYGLNDEFEVYLKSGYYKENFFDSRFNFEGWNLLLGIELSN